MQRCETLLAVDDLAALDRARRIGELLPHDGAKEMRVSFARAQVLIALAKASSAKPPQRYSSNGNGVAQHLIGALFQQRP